MKNASIIQRLLQKNYLVFIISVIISVSIWVYMSMGASNDTNVTVSNIPIQVELSDSSRELGLQVFTGDELTASVTVTGNRTILGSVTAADLTVTASANSVNSSGNFTLPVSAAKTAASSNFQISNSTPSSVNVLIDYYKESYFQLQDNVYFHVKSGYYGTTSLPYNEVSVSGPQSEVKKIKKVVAKANIDGELTESQDVEATVVLYDESGNELPTKLLNVSVTTLTANVSVLPEKNVPLQPVFVNKPEGLEITDDMISIEPSEILLAGEQKTLDKIKSATLEAIDFSQLTNEEITFDSLSIDMPENCKNITNSTTAKVVLDLSNLETKTFTVDRFSLKGLSSNLKATVTSKSIDVTVVGPADEIESLSAERITAVIDASAASEKTGSVEMPVSFKFSNTVQCWASGTYQANLTITGK